MQATQTELSAQQLVLAFLGFYKGAIDGVWSDDSIKAMRAFECDDLFCPAVPTQGLPFKAGTKLPKGMYWDKKLVSHRKLTVEKAQELITSRTKKVLPVNTVPMAHVKTAKDTPVKTEVVSEDAQE